MSSLLDHIPDPHVLAQFKLHAARIDAALAKAGDTGDYVPVTVSPTAPAHPTEGTAFWVQNTLPYVIYLSVRDANGLREWVDITTPSVGGPGGSGVVDDYASAGALPAASSVQGEFASVTTASSSALYFSVRKRGSAASYEWVPLWYFEL